MKSLSLAVLALVTLATPSFAACAAVQLPTTPEQRNGPFAQCTGLFDTSPECLPVSLSDNNNADNEASTVTRYFETDASGNTKQVVRCN